jgi:hypothetical protein
MDNTQARRDNMEDNADHELRDLQRLRVGPITKINWRGGRD